MTPYEESASFLSPLYQPPLPIEKPRGSDFTPSPRSAQTNKPRVFASPLDQDLPSRSHSAGHRELFHRHHPDERSENRKEKSRSKHGGELRTEVKIVMGVVELAEMKKKERRGKEKSTRSGNGGTGSSNDERSGTNTARGSLEDGLLGLLGNGKMGNLLSEVGGKSGGELGTVFAGGVSLIEEKVVESRRQKLSVPTSPSVKTGSGKQSHLNEKVEKRIGEVALGGAVLAGGAYMIKKRVEENTNGREANTRRTDIPVPLPIPVPTLEAYSNQKINMTQGRKGKVSVVHSPLLPNQHFFGKFAAPQKTFLNNLTKREHILIQHGAASLLLKEPFIMNIVGSFEGMVRIVQKGEKGEREVDSGGMSFQGFPNGSK